MKTVWECLLSVNTFYLKKCIWFKFHGNIFNMVKIGYMLAGSVGILRRKTPCGVSYAPQSCDQSGKGKSTVYRL